MRTIFNILLMFAVGFPLFYGNVLFAQYDQAETDKEIKQYCPQGLEDKNHKPICGLTRDSIFPTLFALSIVLYVIVFLARFLEPKPEKESK